MSRFSFRNSSRIIALDRFMRDRIVAKGIPTEKITVLPPWSQDHDVRFDAAGREAFRQQHGLAGKYVVMYSGNHSPVHPLDTLMAAAEALQGSPGVLFAFVGGGSEFKRVKQWAEAGKRGNVLCLPYQPLAQLSGSLSAADAHVVVMGEAMRGLVHPCKIYNMLSVGAPVIYIGPQPAHVTEILDAPGVAHPWCSVRHGEGTILAEHIRRMAAAGEQRGSPKELTAKFAKDALMPVFIADVERREG